MGICVQCEHGEDDEYGSPLNDDDLCEDCFIENFEDDDDES
jgi:hypothetical protein